MHATRITFSSLRSIARYNIVRCEKGPKHLVTIRHKGRDYRIFMGDVNDFTNLGCLNFMDTVVSVGKDSVAGRVKKLFDTKKKTLKVDGNEIAITPFRNSQFNPVKTKLKKVSKNAHVLSYTMESRNGSTMKKSLLFYHLFNKQIKKNKDAEKILKGLNKYSEKSTNNVLFIADHLEPKSILALKYLLTEYKYLSIKSIVAITYRRIPIFSGVLLHNYHHHRHRLHHSHHHN